VKEYTPPFPSRYLNWLIWWLICRITETFYENVRLLAWKQQFPLTFCNNFGISNQNALVKAGIHDPGESAHFLLIDPMSVILSPLIWSFF